MLQEGPVWFLVADGRRARVLIEERRGDMLSEPADWIMEISADELYEPQDRPPRAHDRMGATRHGMDEGRNLREEEEEKFLKRVAGRIGEAEKKGAFSHLVVAAPPRALGLLRTSLPGAALQRLRADLPKDVVDEAAAALRTRLQDLLRR
jgi:protein required for attachment to host cells